MTWSFVGNRIQLAREASDVSQSKLAELIGVSQQQVSQWEKEDVKPSQDTLCKICNALRTPPRFFFVSIGNFGNNDENHA